jgi:hypothetical protein
LTAFSCEQLICPSCQSVAVDLKRKSAASLAPSRLDKRGASRSSRNVRRDAMDAARAPDESANRIRRSRVVLMPRRRHQVGENHFAGDGDKKARSPGRARRKPLKPFVQGRPDEFGVPVVTTLVWFFQLSMRGCGCYPSARLSLRPLDPEGRRSCKTRARMRRGNAQVRRCEEWRSNAAPSRGDDDFGQPWR